MQAKNFLGTTKKGIGPTYAAKTLRFGLRVGDLYNWPKFGEKYRRMASYYKDQNGSAPNI